MVEKLLDLRVMDKGIGGVLQIGYVRIQRDVGLLDDALVGACGLFNPSVDDWYQKRRAEGGQ